MERSFDLSFNWGDTDETRPYKNMRSDVALYLYSPVGEAGCVLSRFIN